MFSIVINEKGGQPRVMEFDKGEVTIGRVAGNDIVLPKGNISKRHSRIVQKDGKFIIVDLKSTNGTYVNGKKITSPQVIKETDKIYIGDFTLSIEMSAGEEGAGDSTVGAGPASMRGKAPPPQKAPPPPPDDFEDEPAEQDAEEFIPAQEEDLRPLPESEEDGGEAEGDAGPEYEDEEFDAVPPEPEPPPPPPPPARAIGKAPPAPVARTQTASPTEPRPPAKPIIKASAAPPTPARSPDPRPVVSDSKAAPPEPRPGTSGSKGTPPPAPNRSSEREAVLERAAMVARDLYDALTIWLTEQGVDTAVLPDDELRERVRQGIQDCGDKVIDNLPRGISRQEIESLVEREVIGLGPLDDLLEEADVDEIFINGPRYIAVTRGGTATLTDSYFSSDTTLTLAVERLLLRTGIRMSEDTTVVDARLKEGGHLHAILPPAAPRGPVVTWRRGGHTALGVDDLATNGTIPGGLVEFLEMCIQARRNVLITGPASAGKTTLLGALASLIPNHERVVTVEEVAELVLPQPQVVSLETCPPRGNEMSAVELPALIRAALRIRPNRLVVGECRGGEALPLLQAMSAGQDGTLLTLHAHSPRDCLARLEMMVLMAGQDLPVKAVRELIANAVDIIMVVTRHSDNNRHVTQVCEVSGMEVDIITMQDIFTSKREGETGGPGRLMATGFVPRFYEQMQQQGLNPNVGIFREDD